MGSSTKTGGRGAKRGGAVCCAQCGKEIENIPFLSSGRREGAAAFILCQECFGEESYANSGRNFFLDFFAAGGESADDIVSRLL